MNNALVAVTHGRGFYRATPGSAASFTDDPLVAGVTLVGCTYERCAHASTR